jgi:long-subunit fatty acid transport protein
MKRIIFRSSKLILIIILLLSSNFYAQNVNDALRVGIPGLGANARALGMGNSFIGLSDDASAAFFNPAGFGLLKKLEFSGGINYGNFNNSVDFLNARGTEYSNSATKLNRLSFAFPFPTMRGSLVFGLSYHQTKDFTSALKFDGLNNGNTSLIQDFLDTDIPFDLYLTDQDNVTPINGGLNQSGTILSSGVINNWTFSGAIEVYKNLFMGLNLNIITGNYKSDNEYYEDDTENIYQGIIASDEPQSEDFQTFYLNRILDWDISGWDAKFGILYQLSSNARFGLTVQFPKTYNIKEDFSVNGYSLFGTEFSPELDRDKYSDAVEYEIITPIELAGGFSVNFAGLILSAQATLIDYSQIEFEDVEGLGTPLVSSLNRDIKDLLTSAINYNAGIEYTVPQIGMRLRGGFFVQPSPYQGDPSEFDRKYFTTGIGFLADESVGIDVAYAHGWWKDYGDNYGSEVSRTFQDVTSDYIILTGIYRF